TARYPREARETNADTSCVRQPEARNTRCQAVRTLQPTTAFPQRKRRARATRASSLSPARGRRPRGQWACLGAARARRDRGAAHSGSRHGKPDRWQSALYIRASGLEPGRELERRAEAVGCLVDRKSGRIGCNLEQDPARLAKIDRTKILTVENRRHVEAERDNLFPPDMLLLVRLGAKRDVMHGSSTEPALDRFGMAQHVELGPDGSVAGVCRTQATPPGVFRDLTIAERFGQQLDRPLRRFDAQCHRPKSADRCGNIAVAPRGIGGFEAMARRDLELQPVRIAKSDRWTRETRERSVDVDAPLGEPNYPAVQGFRRRRERHCIDHAAAAAAAASRHERKERENRARMSRLVSVIEMIGA